MPIDNIARTDDMIILLKGLGLSDSEVLCVFKGVDVTIPKDTCSNWWSIWSRLREAEEQGGLLLALSDEQWASFVDNAMKWLTPSIPPPNLKYIIDTESYIFNCTILYKYQLIKVILEAKCNKSL